jgi:hypothetical protein
MATNIPRANPTIASYNASIVNFYNATGSLACFEDKKYFILQRLRCSCKFKNRRIGSSTLHFKAIQNCSKLGFLVLKQIIWQPCLY